MMDDSKNSNFLGSVKQTAKKLETILFVPSASVVDEGDRLRAYVTAVLLLMFGLGFIAAVVITLVTGNTASTLMDWRFFAVGLVVVLFAYALSRTKHFLWGLGISLVPAVLTSYATLFDTVDPGSIPSVHQWMILPLIIGGVLLGPAAYRVLAVLILIPPIIQVFTLAPEFKPSLVSAVVFLIISASLISLATYFHSRLATQALADFQAKNLAEKEGIIQQLQQAEALQQQRARVIEASYEINSKLATILDPKQLIGEVINQIQALFHYNYVQLYLMDDAGENLVVAGGTGEAGQLLYSRRHQIPMGKGLVGQAAVTNEYVLVDDVSQIGSWISNPLLPNTKSELAVPIAIGDTVLGVLDVQHDEEDALGAEDISLLQSVASAVAIALQNARLYRQSQKRADQESITNQINQQLLSAPTMERVLEIAAQELGQALKAKNTTVQLSLRKNSVENGRYSGEKI
jgi:putative methionine-R-sulfoxide reductase with GAF domain